MFHYIWNDQQDRVKQRIDKEEQDENTQDDDTTKFPT